MAALQEGTSASVNSKEKKSLLDEEIGTDFFSSWKSISVTEDNAMDFSFDTFPNGKKKFNFDKLDMDFNLDGDFDKFTSFKVDMPDLDFSCSSKRTTKTKERSDEDSSGGKLQGKKGHFNFSFDFNDEDFTSDAQIGGKPECNSKSLTRNEPILLTSEMDVNKHSNIREGLNFDNAQHGSKLVGNSGPEDKQVTEGEPSTLGSKKNAGRDNIDASGVQIVTKIVGNSKPLTRELTDDEPAFLRSKNNVENHGDIREHIKSDGVQSESKLAADAKQQDKLVAVEEPVIPESERSIEEDFNTNDAQITDNLVASKSLSGEFITNKPVSLGSERDVKSLSDIREDFNTNDGQITNNLVTSKSPSRESTTNKPVSLRSEKDVKNLYNIREGITADYVQNGSEIVGNSRQEDEEVTTRELLVLRSEKISGKVVGNSGMQDKEVTIGEEPVILRREKIFGKVVSNLRLQEKEVTTGEPVMLRSGKIKGNLQMSSSSSTEKTSKSSTETSENPKFVVSSMQSIQNVENDFVEGLKTGKRTLDLSSLKNFRVAGPNREIPNSKVLRQSNSPRNAEQKMKLLGDMRSNIPHPISGTEKQKHLTPSLKRKKIEESNAELVPLKPLKRLSESPKKNRNFKESSGRIIDEEVCNHENRRQSKNETVLHDLSTSRLEVSQDINMTELEISVVMENDGNVEKAEAFAKELEDIYNMLKKKHEEAKELLVRAIVNNNNLLMLNHPINEEKIRMVQKFATQLSLKEVPT